MPKFSIIPKGGGAARYSGTPTYTGTYMKTGVLEFREVASPTPIPFSVGDYVVYSRTGRTYRLYELPQVKKQAANSKYGGGYLYQNVQFKDDSYQLEICPFRDLVVGDNRVHFSTQPAISVWDDVAGIAERIQACLDDMYGSGAWVIRLATTSEGLDPDLATLMTDERDFSVSGVSCLGVLAKIYEVWPNIGWVYKVESGVNTIVIGGAGLNVAQSSSYGKGNGLLSITRNVANADQLANRLYVYGSSRNMLSKWYSQFAIKDAQSVDIQNLMLPIERPSDVPAAQYGGWGKSDDGGVMKPDPAKAFVEDATLAAANLRPKTVYFDGSEDLKEIYPTISGMTIADVIQAKSDYGDTDYVPDTSIYTDTSVRVDQVLAVLSTFDSGLAAAAGKSAYTLNYGTYAHSGQSVSVPAGQTLTRQIFRDEFLVSPGRSDFLAEFPAFGLIGGGQAAYLDFILERKHSGSYEQFFTQRVQLNNGDAGSRSIGAGSVKCDNNEMVFASGDKVRITMSLVLDNTSGTSAASGLLSNASGTLTYGAKVHRDKTFQIRLRQLGFNIQEQAALGEGKAIAFTSGRCAGRSFNIQSCVYESDTDSWLLDVWRSEDESLAQYFPNADYPIAAGDEFVLLEIAMPAIYVHVAEHRLLDAALELLADTKVEQWQYTPEIDAKFMVENSRTINAGEVIGLTDADVVVDAGPFLVDSVSINEGDAEIPTYKVTLRERKKKSYTDTGGAVSSNSRSVGGSTDNDELANVYSLLHFKADKSALVDLLKKDDYHFENDPDFADEVKLKAAYDGLRVPGLRFGIGRTDFDLEVRNIAGEGETPVWVLYSPLPLITGGDQIVGTGTPGGGGGGGATKLWQLDDVDVPSDPLEIVDGQALLWNAATQRWINANVVTDLSNYYTKAQTYSKAEVDGMVEDISDAMDNLQAQIDAVSSRDMFDELTASVFFADIIAASDIYGALHGDADNALNLEGHAASYFAAAGDVTALENNFDSSGNAKAALKLTTSGPLSIWGVQYWNNGIPSDVTGRPNLYIGSTQVQTAGNTQPLEGISTITLVAQGTRSTSGNVIEVVTESDGQGGTITYLHTTLPIISDGDQIVGDGTPGSGSGGGVAYLHELLDVIANLAPSDGYLLAWDAYATSQSGRTGAWKAISQSSVLAPVTALIPAQASASNQLADKDFVNSSIATATATYRGSYNLVSDLGLTTAATESQIGTALASAVSGEDNNDYAFVQVPTSDATPTEIARTDRYKYNGSAWVFEYSLNNSGYTAAQWAAINSGITTAKRQGYDAIAGYFDANGKLTPAHVGDLSATYALVSHTHTIAQVTNLQDELDALSARIDSVASRDDFDELTASVIFADIIAADIFYGNLEGNADTATDADKLDGQHGSYYATASSVSTLQDYFDAGGNAKSALKLTTVSKTAWGRTFWTANGVPDSVSGDMDSVGKIAFTAQNAKSTTGFVLEVVTESDGQGGTITYLHTTLPIISDGDQIVGTGTPGGGGGGGASKLWQLDDVNVPSDPSAITDGQALVWNASQERWVNAAVITDLSNYYTKAETYSQAEVNALIGAIDQFHYEIAASTSAVVDPQSNVLYLIGPTGSGADKYEEYVYTNSTWTKIGDTSIDLSNYYTKSETYSKTEVDTALNGYVPTTRTVSGTGYLTGGGALSQNQTLDIASAVKTKIDHGESAYSALPDINALLDNLQAQVDAVSSRDCYDELTATVFYSDIVAATDIYGALHGDADNALNLEGHAASYFATASAVTTLQGYFDNSGNAKTALKLTTSGPLNIWGVQYWNSGVPSAVTGRPSFGAGADVPAGQTFKIGDATFSWVAGSNGNPGYLYVDTAFMSAGDQIIGSGTPGQGGGGGGKNYLYELLDTAYAWDAAFPTGISEQQVLVYTPNADSKNGTGTGAWSYVPKTAVGAFYTAGTGLALSNANVFSLDVNAAKIALGLGDAAYLGVASAIGASVSGVVSGALLYDVLGDSFDSTNTVKAFVNSSIATATATFRGTNTTATTESAFLTWANALTHDLNDYVFWQTTDSYGNTIYKRYKFDGTNWVFEYNLNNSSFTTAQWDAINSGITSTKRSGYDTIVGYFTNGQLQAAHVGDLSGTYLPKSGGSMNNTTVVTNLNADLLDGKHANEFAAATHSHTISQVTNLESNLDTLSGRIDAIGSRNMFDELSASVFFSDIVTASTAYIESIVGSLTGTASNASQLEGHAASYFATASSLNSYLLLSGGTMTGVLTMKGSQYQDAYDGALNMNNSDIYGLNSIYTADASDSPAEGIHFYRDSTHVDSLRMASGALLFTPNRQLGTNGTEYTVYHSGNSNKADVGWRCDNLVATCVELIPPSGSSNGGYIDFHHGGSSADYTTRLIEWTSGKLTCEGNFHVNGTFTSSGDQTISSDEALKINIKNIKLSVKDIASVRAVTFDWKDGSGHSFGTIAQDWLGILPEAVLGDAGNYSVAYAQTATVAAVVNSREIVEIEKHETEQDKEIRKLKAKVKKLEAEVKRLRMN